MRKVAVRRLDLRETNGEIDRMVEEAWEDWFPSPDWDDLLETGESGEYTSDEVYLRWLQDRLQAKEWGKAKRMMPDGSVKSVEVPVAIAQMVAIANLADALADALSQKGAVTGDAERDR